MFAVFTEVDIPHGVPTDGAAEGLRSTAVPAVRAAGAVTPTGWRRRTDAP